MYLWDPKITHLFYNVTNDIFICQNQNWIKAYNLVCANWLDVTINHGCEGLSLRSQLQ